MLLFHLTRDQDTVAPLLCPDYLVGTLHLTVAVLFVLIKLSGVDGPIRGGENTAAIAHVIFPLALVAVLLPCENFTLAVALV